MKGEDKFWQTLKGAVREYIIENSVNGVVAGEVTIRAALMLADMATGILEAGEKSTLKEMTWGQVNLN